MDNSENSTKQHPVRQPHVVLAMLAGPGHYNPLLQLLFHIARYDGATVTVVTNDEKMSELRRLQSRGDFRSLNLHLEPVFKPPVLDFSNPKFPVNVKMLIKGFAEDFQPFATNLIQKKNLPGAPTCVIADALLSFTKGLAAGLEIPWYPFFPSSPGLAVCFLEAPRLRAFRDQSLSQGRPDPDHGSLDVCGIKYATFQDLPDGVVATTPIDNGDVISRATGILFNTTEELDAPTEALDAVRSGTGLRASAKSRQNPGPKVFAIGPLLNFPGFAARRNGEHEEESATPSNSSPVMKFLNAQASSSVLYISFGSVATIEPEAIIELAHGIEASGVPFVWVLKLRKFWGSDIDEFLPPGFSERMKGRGFIETGWAPQAQILSHPSTGGFLSHCGWNSVLESFCSAMPVITWPVGAEQKLNARFMEKVVNTGISMMQTKTALQKDDDTDGIRRQQQQQLLQDDLPSRDDVLRAVNMVMKGEKGQELRKNAEQVKKLLRAGSAEGGSSHQALRMFLDEIMLSCQEGKTRI